MIWSSLPRSRCARRKARFSCRRRRRSSAFSTMSFSSSTSKGFWMKSSAPSLKASRAVSTVAKAVIITMPASGKNSRTRRSSSMPFMSGIRTSEMTRSAVSSRRSSNARAPFSAERTAWPAPRPKTCVKSCRMPGSSSTIRRFAIGLIRDRARRAPSAAVAVPLPEVAVNDGSQISYGLVRLLDVLSRYHLRLNEGVDFGVGILEAFHCRRGEAREEVLNLGDLVFPLRLRLLQLLNVRSDLGLVVDDELHRPLHLFISHL